MSAAQRRIADLRAALVAAGVPLTRDGAVVLDILCRWMSDPVASQVTSWVRMAAADPHPGHDDPVTGGPLPSGVDGWHVGGGAS